MDKKNSIHYPILPATLFDAESDLFNSLKISLSENRHTKLIINLKFENLRLLPIVYRLFNNLKSIDQKPILLWADAGAAALAKRDMPDITNFIYSYNDFQKYLPISDGSELLIAVNPHPFDFDEFKNICDQFIGQIIMINGKLEDMAVGIGTVGRDRRKDFINLWQIIYWLQPLSRGALLKLNKREWYLYKLIENKYIFCDSFENKPDEESILLSLSELK